LHASLLLSLVLRSLSSFFFNDTSTSAIYTLSLHDALPIYLLCTKFADVFFQIRQIITPPKLQYTNLILVTNFDCVKYSSQFPIRSEEHTSELQSRENLVCRLLLEKKKKQ